MTYFRLIIRNFIYYLQKNLLLCLGVAVSAAVLTGALIVGNSVNYSLNRIVADRLGEVNYAMKSGDRFFTQSLAGKMEKDLSVQTSPVLQTSGIAIANGGQQRINNVNVLGVDDHFDRMAGLEDFYGKLKEGEIIISQNLATRLNSDKG
ncbi:MAG: hypothetical protein ACP5E3_11175, partial [Bacteroidales bacterium]